MEAAIDWLRAKGIAKADKKSGRTAAEGLIAVASEGNSAVVVEVNSETDFVARNDGFQDLARSIANVALSTDGSAEAVSAATVASTGKSVTDTVKDAIAHIGENMNFRRSAKLSVDDGVVATYVHNAVADGLGKLGVIVAVKSTGDKDALNEIGRQVAMHIAATNPMALTSDDVDATVADRVSATCSSEQARESGKPENIIEKMVEGRLRKFYEEVALVSQAFVMNPDLTVGKAVEGSRRTSVRRLKLLRSRASSSVKASRRKRATLQPKSLQPQRADLWQLQGFLPKKSRRASRDNAVPFVYPGLTHQNPDQFMSAAPLFKRVLLKASGEALMGEQGFGIDVAVVDRIAGDIKEVRRMGSSRRRDRRRQHLPRRRRGLEGRRPRYRRPHGHAGNRYQFAGSARPPFVKKDVDAEVLSAIAMPQLCESFSQRKAMWNIEQGRVVIFAGGTGNPYFTTDSAAALRAAEMGAEALFKGTQVDGVYSADPKKFPDAERFQNDHP
jgi:elongation factor Ts